MKNKNKTMLIAFLLFSLVFSFLYNANLSAYSAPTPTPTPPPVYTWPLSPEISAGGAIVIDAASGIILYDKNSKQSFYPASTTKLMTALISVEQGQLSDIVTASHNAVYSIGWDSSRLALKENESISFEDALYALLLDSDNDVAIALAEHVGGTYNNFIDMMNSRANELGCVNTHFSNPHGLDDTTHYSCPYDLALIMKQAVTYTTFTRISGSGNHVVPATNLTSETRAFLNTHLMLTKSAEKKIKYDGVYAGKTGHTSIAKYSLVTACKRNNLSVICVVMSCPSQTDTYNDTKKLLDYTFNNFENNTLKTSDSGSNNAFPMLFDESFIVPFDYKSPLSTDQPTLILPKNADHSRISTSIEYLKDGIYEDGKKQIGYVTYFFDNHLVGKSPVYLNQNLTSEPTPLPIKDEKKESPSKGWKLSKKALVKALISSFIVWLVGHFIVLYVIPERKRKQRIHK